MQMSQAIPILRIFSEDKAREFYVDFLGFKLDWEHRFGDNFPLYAQVSRSGLVLHLSEHHGDATPGSAIFIPIDDVDALHAELTARAYRYAKPGVEDAGWGRQLQVKDPFGNRLCFCQQTEA
ncbi:MULTISPECIES: glyoxalase superfamily protein [Cupriavidus]|uniref:Bleomycin resistance protein n=1 Tax=Cupriavidus pauculus TaxID=82633 RepID=A0A3G8H1X2_9BURK|nr:MULTISPECIES: glyoxalase superfamily protein [Cupriavidus]AZG14521.1 VOC family protein [Cupriavidus pauculus]MDT6961705.1 glyoxalase superfamily protein [Cupriavidus sp. SZY C1]